MNSFESFDYSSWKQLNSIACGRDILLNFRFYFVNRNHRYTFLRNLFQFVRTVWNYTELWNARNPCVYVKKEKGDNNLTQQRYAI